MNEKDYEVIMHLSNGAKIFCTAKAAKYLMIGFGLEPVTPHPVSDAVELLPDGDIRKVVKK